MPRPNLKCVPLGERQRIRILALLKTDGAMSKTHIGERIHLTGEGVLKHLKLMREETPRRVYIESYAINGRGRPSPLYAAGDKPDAEYVYEFIAQNHHQDLLSQLVAELEQAPRTVRELACLMHLSVSGVRNLVNELREMGWCRIGAWSPVVNRNSAPIYALGLGKDAAKKTKTRADRWKEEKADKEEHERAVTKRRAYAAVKRAKSAPRSWFASLPGAQSIVQHREAA